MAIGWLDGCSDGWAEGSDVGCFDEDGFLVLMDRKKDMIISGGFNIYPSDLEAVLLKHPSIIDAAVVGVPSESWGETPVGFIVINNSDDNSISAEKIKDWANSQLGKTQRLFNVKIIEELPRSHIGKILKKELRATWK